MSVDYHFLSISEQELKATIDIPESIFELIEQLDTEHLWLGPDGKAIVALISENAEDPLAFIIEGASESVSGYIGKYKDGDCEIDMGYGPCSYYHNSFLQEVIEKLELITPELFTEHCDVEWLEENSVYPTGWLDQGRKEELIKSFTVYREYILNTVKSGKHLLVWCS